MNITALADAAEEARVAAARAYQALDAAKRAEAVRTEPHWVKSRGKYGRTEYRLQRYHFNAAGHLNAHDRDLAVVVVLPKAYTDHYGLDQKYLLNWAPRSSVNAAEHVSHHRTLKAAKAAAESRHP